MIEHGRFEVAKNLGKKDCVVYVKLLRGHKLQLTTILMYWPKILFRESARELSSSTEGSLQHANCKIRRTIGVVNNGWVGSLKRTATMLKVASLTKVIILGVRISSVANNR